MIKDKPQIDVFDQFAVFAHMEGLVVARHIAARISGQPLHDLFCGDGYCMLEAGEDLAGFAFGNFFAEPSPDVRLKKLGKVWHWGKVLFEKWWLSPYGVKRSFLRTALQLGSKAAGLPSVF